LTKFGLREPAVNRRFNEKGFGKAAESLLFPSKSKVVFPNRAPRILEKPL
jgi:hypothetical protein